MVNWNNLLAYYTVKYVMIRDWKLGVLQKGLMGLIFFKILFLVVLKSNTHLLEVPVSGSARAAAQQPTKDNCNPLEVTCVSDFTPLSDLKYCTQYDESRRLLPKEFVHKHGIPKAECVLWDAPAMTRGRSPVPGTLFIPTRILDYVQVKGCSPTKENGYKCSTKPWVRKDKTKKPNMIYVGDVERFSIIINQAFNAELGGKEVQGRAADFNAYIHGEKGMTNFHTKHKGYFKHWDKFLKKVLTSTEIPKDPVPNGVFPGAYSSALGDVMQIGDLITLADARGAELLDLVREDGTTMRSEGGVLDVSIEYSNKATFDPMGQTVPHYTITAKFLPMRYYKIAYETMHKGEEERTMHDVHGLLILIRVHGNIRVLSIMHLLTVLTTAMVSLAMATTLTDYIMQYLFRFSENYTILKFQPTQDYTTLAQRQAALRSKHKDKYSPLDHKAMPHADILNDRAAEERAPEGKDLLMCLLKFEQRLNRLDGMDEQNAIIPDKANQKDMDKAAIFIQKFEADYMTSKHGMTGGME